MVGVDYPLSDSRTPAEVMADGLFMLVYRGFFPNKERIHEACRVLGLSVEDLHQAAIRLQPNPGRYCPPAGSIRQPAARVAVAPAAPPPTASGPGPAPTAPPTPPPSGTASQEAPAPAGAILVDVAPRSHAARAHGGHRPTSKAPMPAPAAPTSPLDVDHRCERCGKRKPPERFALRGGYRARKCLVCEWIVGRRRRFEEAVGRELLSGRPVVLRDGSPLLDGSCVFECGRPLEAGQPLVAVDVALAHYRCMPDAGQLSGRDEQ